jgi:hypothetical protein
MTTMASFRSRLCSALRRFGRDTSGAALIELAVTFPLFLLILFALIDFGRMSYSYVMAEKAAQIAVRTAAVRPVACPTALPQTHQANAGARFGTYCRSGGSCLPVATVACAGAAGNPTVDEVWARIAPLMPAGATAANLWFSYDFDPDLGFVGGPYTPMLTVEIRNATFDFVLPIGPLGALVSGGTNTFANQIQFPRISNSLPAEDLNVGSAG